MSSSVRRRDTQPNSQNLLQYSCAPRLLSPRLSTDPVTVSSSSSSSSFSSSTLPLPPPPPPTSLPPTSSASVAVTNKRRRRRATVKRKQELQQRMEALVEAQCELPPRKMQRYATLHPDCHLTPLDTQALLLPLHQQTIEVCREKLSSRAVKARAAVRVSTLAMERYPSLSFFAFFAFFRSFFLSSFRPLIGGAM